tara:strand:+ start:266 stop:691 length:426 start_codon:yes stop_codon:yes gene_type:complete
MGLNPNIWGSKAWFFLHSIALNYPKYPTEKDKQDFKIFFESLANVIPCPDCSEHYKNNILKNPIDLNLNNNIDLNKWLVNIHNNVNIKNNKNVITYEHFLKNYKNIYDNNNSIVLHYIIPCLILIIIFFLITYKIYHKFKL